MERILLGKGLREAATALISIMQAIAIAVAVSKMTTTTHSIRSTLCGCQNYPDEPYEVVLKIND